MRLDILDDKEHHIEEAWIRAVDKNGGYTRKFVSVNNRSVPDRISIINGWVFFTEFKAPGKKLTDNQRTESFKIIAQGGLYFVASEREHVRFIIDLIMLAKGPYA